MLTHETSESDSSTPLYAHTQKYCSKNTPHCFSYRCTHNSSALMHELTYTVLCRRIFLFLFFEVFNILSNLQMSNKSRKRKKSNKEAHFAEVTAVGVFFANPETEVFVQLLCDEAVAVSDMDHMGSCSEAWAPDNKKLLICQLSPEQVY